MMNYRCLIICALTLVLFGEAMANSPLETWVEEKTVAELQHAMATGELSSEDLVNAYLNRIRRYDPRLRAIISLNPRAVKEARRLDKERTKGKMRGPLHGIPFLVKDSIDVKGLPTSGGTPLLAKAYPQSDAFIIARLRKAGAILLGKTNLDELQMGGTGLSTLGGQTLNPYDSRYIPGGSSSGSAVGIAANLATLGIGADTMGSIRAPSGINGLVGLRPTAGLVSRTGSMPGTNVFDTIGPMSRTVEDLALTLDVIVGEDALDPITNRSRGKIPKMGYINALHRDGLKGVRLGYIKEFVEPSLPQTPEAKQALQLSLRILNDLEKQGAEVFPVSIPSDVLHEVAALQQDSRSLIGEAGILWKTYFRGITGVDFSTLLQLSWPNGQALFVHHPLITKFSYRGSVLLKGGSPFHPSQKESFVNRQKALQRRVEQFLDQGTGRRLEAMVLTPLGDGNLLTPDEPFLGVTPVPGIKTGLSNDDINQALSSVTGLPSLVVPADFNAEGRPSSITFLGRGFSEEQLLRMGYAYEQSTQHRRPPILE